jgi:hypothetical protein
MAIPQWLRFQDKFSGMPRLTGAAAKVLTEHRGRSLSFETDDPIYGWGYT